MPIFTDDIKYLVSSSSRESNQQKMEDRFMRNWELLNANSLQINKGKTNLTEFMTKTEVGKAERSAAGADSHREVGEQSRYGHHGGQAADGQKLAVSYSA